MAATVLPVAHLVEQLGRLEQEQKRLGMVNQAQGLRLAIVTVLSEAEKDEPPPAGTRSAMQAMAETLAKN